MYKYVVFVSIGEGFYDAVFCRAENMQEAMETVKTCYPEWTPLHATLIPTNLDGLVDGVWESQATNVAKTLRPVK